MRGTSDGLRGRGQGGRGGGGLGRTTIQFLGSSGAGVALWAAGGGAGAAQAALGSTQPARAIGSNRNRNEFIIRSCNQRYLSHSFCCHAPSCHTPYTLLLCHVASLPRPPATRRCLDSSPSEGEKSKKAKVARRPTFADCPPQGWERGAPMPMPRRCAGWGPRRDLFSKPTGMARCRPPSPPPSPFPRSRDSGGPRAGLRPRPSFFPARQHATLAARPCDQSRWSFRRRGGGREVSRCELLYCVSLSTVNRRPLRVTQWAVLAPNQCLALLSPCTPCTSLLSSPPPPHTLRIALSGPPPSPCPYLPCCIDAVLLIRIHDSSWRKGSVAAASVWERAGGRWRGAGNPPPTQH